ncbi:hypothetical protein [Nonlabens antarcticus]|uniref:hypothetical protein n=1 Tax=Nonlabens antarcticus TaxID=392714 RepID=UPI0018911DA7|nr:hypothetical protein [Nonlabens antarcticus]
MKNKITLIVALLIGTIGMACPVCKEKQPAGFENITHGQGPEGNIDYIIMWSAIVIVGYTLIMSIKFLVKPKENQKDHIKNLVVEDQNSN